uniref:Uncharacterized protein n=1 Tax=Timema shepardi TaxID=629360 RepID=A0A7R9G051_TIMSH|nr:unnamed protein product [Timema shepardi]
MHVRRALVHHIVVASRYLSDFHPIALATVVIICDVIDLGGGRRGRAVMSGKVQAAELRPLLPKRRRLMEIIGGGGYTLNGQTLLEFSHSQDMEGGGTNSELRIKVATLWVRIEFRTGLSRAYRRSQPDRNLTMWVFKVNRQLHANATLLRGKVGSSLEEDFPTPTFLEFNDFVVGEASLKLLFQLVYSTVRQKIHMNIVA